MTDPPGAAFVETREYRRFREFCNACRRDRYIGLCYGPAGVGKTLSARHYADWDRVEATRPYAALGDFRSDDVPGNGCVLYTATVVNSPRQIEDDIARLFGRMRELVRQAIRTEAEPGIAVAQRRLEEEHDRFLIEHDWLTGPSERLRRAEAAVSEAILDRAERDRWVRNPTDLLLVDEVDRVKMAGLEQLRDIFDGGGLGLVLIGMPGLERRLARYAQLYSRIGFVHEFRPLGAAEVRTLLAGWRPHGATLPADLLADAEAVGGDHPGHRRELPAAGPVADAGGADSGAQRAGDGDARGGRGGAGGPGDRGRLTSGRRRPVGTSLDGTGADPLPRPN